MQTSVPPRPRRSATRRACPPAPKVQSTATSPGAGSSASISSPASTGTWVEVMSRRMAKALCEVGDAGAQVALVGDPGLAVPDLEALDVPHHRHVLLDSRVVEERLVQRHAAGCVELDVERVAGEVAREL